MNFNLNIYSSVATLALPAVQRQQANVSNLHLSPIFVQEPDEVYYVVKGKPVTITCRASFAVQIFLQCAGQWIDPARHTKTQITDPDSQTHLLQTSVEILKEEVEEYFGDDGYWCVCHAVNSPPGAQPKTTKSRRGQILVACKFSFVTVYHILLVEWMP